MGEFVYILCALTSIACTVLLLRGYARTGMPLLFWSGAAFFAFAISNSLLVADLVVLPQYDLLLFRLAVNLAGVILLLYGLIRTNS
ncbi:MAG TPA: DUF5985 family protein [Verrucomicrobiae bacterium]|jgi:hypothetical protein|nr:DUF5985 family protein [Verrucomicrobiae bacterium]